MIKKLYDKCVNWAGHRFAKPILAFEQESDCDEELLRLKYTV